VVLAVALLALIITGVAGVFIYGEQSSVTAGTFKRASLLLDEGLEAVKNLKSDNFASIEVGTYGLGIQTDNTWDLTSSPDITDNFFTRTIEISSLDQTTLEVVVSISWDGVYQTQQVSGTIHVTNWGRERKTPGMLVFADLSGEQDTIKYKLLDEEGEWSSEQTVPDFNIPRNRSSHTVELYSSTSRNEKILVVRFAGNGPGDDTYIYASVWDGSSWGNTIELASWAGIKSSHTRNYDGSYRNDGIFLIAYSDDSESIKYRTWDGSVWSSEENGPDIGEIPQWILLATDPGGGTTGTETLLVVLDDGRDTNVSTFNGTSWSSTIELASDAEDDNYEQLSFDFSLSSNIGMLMFNNGGDDYPNLYSWVEGSGWFQTDEALNFGNPALNMKIISRPGEDEYIGCALDSGNDINCAYTGTTPGFSSLIPFELENNAEEGFQSSYEIAYERSGSLALIVYSGDPSQSVPKYRTFNPGTNSWSAETPYVNLPSELELVKLNRNPHTDDIMVLLGGSALQVHTVVWEGNTDSFYNTGDYGFIEHGEDGSGANDSWFDFEWDMHI
jgi:hypothetical protein